MQIYVNDAEIAKDVTVSAMFFSGLERVDSYAAGGGAVDATADTELSFSTITIVSKPGRIKQIRYSCGQIVDAKSCSGKLILTVPGLAGPFEFAVGNGASGDTLGGTADADVFDVDIPVGTNVIVTFNVTYTDAMDSATVSIAVA